MIRKNISSGAPWEDIVGYSRAVKVGNQVFVSGTTAVNENGEVNSNSVYEQVKFIFQKIESALNQAGAAMSDVVRSRVFTTDISKWEEIGKAHGEIFKTIKPASTMVEIRALISPSILVEIEVDAVINGES